MINETLHRQLNIATRIQLKTGGAFRSYGRVSSANPTSGFHCVTLVANTMISREQFPIIGNEFVIYHDSETTRIDFIT